MRWAALEWLGAADQGRTIRVGDNRGLVRAFAFNDSDWPEDVSAGSARQVEDHRAALLGTGTAYRMRSNKRKEIEGYRRANEGLLT
jgi:hypothetical protein